MFVDSKNEEDFFLSHLKPYFKVLEYGSGESTQQIAERVNHIVSVEHDKNWIEGPQKVSNCTLLYVPYNEVCHAPHDGTYIQFRDYIFAPHNYGPFDIVFVDGRARVECCRYIVPFVNPDGFIFIHDFSRPEYKVILKWLELVEQVGEMAKLRVNYNNLLFDI